MHTILKKTVFQDFFAKYRKSPRKSPCLIFILEWSYPSFFYAETIVLKHTLKIYEQLWNVFQIILLLFRM